MAGISSKGAGKLQNKYQYNGKEKQSGEFNDGSGLEEYDYGARFYDQQIGRFKTLDPLGESSVDISLFAYCSNNPPNRYDLDGQKDRPFNSKTDKVVSIIPNTATPIFIYNYRNERIGYAPGFKNAYNCHSYAWENSKGDPGDRGNVELVKKGITKWDNNPSDNIVKLGASQLSSNESNEVGDRVIYYIDANGNGKYDTGEKIEHSAIVNSVDKDGYTTTVIGKMGENGISINHPDDPEYYKITENGLTSRAYFRLPQPKTKSGDKKKNSQGAKNDDSSEGRTQSWREVASIINSWLKQNSNITITVQ